MKKKHDISVKEEIVKTFWLWIEVCEKTISKKKKTLKEKSKNLNSEWNSIYQNGEYYWFAIADRVFSYTKNVVLFFYYFSLPYRY